mmetsp:Transcript_31926/g.110361  ORF Transcript_31926/g.110361 Transcript_31926/m.110361 type:complete len:300 (-) Transcript_31926:162-1061(-)
MPFLATGPHYRKQVATRQMRPTARMGDYVDLNQTLVRAGASTTRYRHFDDVHASIPHAARCVSCAGRVPAHVRCARGWDYAWCDRSIITQTRQSRCAVKYGAGERKKDCNFCIFSHGFTPGVHQAEPAAWKALRSGLVFHARYEDGARSVAAALWAADGALAAPAPYIALQLRRGDKSTSLDKAGLTVETVLDKAAAVSKRLGKRVFVATDDQSPETLGLIASHGFAVVDAAALLKAALPKEATDSVGLYLVDILLCVLSSTFVGAASKHKTSKQFELIKALRQGRGVDIKSDVLWQSG